MYKLTLLILALAFSSETGTVKPRPQFSDYAVKKIYSGKPAKPILATQHERGYRTMIREGANGPVTFAGHYTVAGWGCGAGCNGAVIVDSITGKIYDIPFSVEELPLAWYEKHPDDPDIRMQFHPDSRLMKFDACLNETDCGFYDYIMVEGKGLQLVRKELLPKEYQ